MNEERREKIVNLARDWYDTHDTVYEFADKVLKLWPTPPVQGSGVSKEAIEGVLSMNDVMPWASMPADSLSRQPFEARRAKLVDDLFALFSGGQQSGVSKVSGEQIRDLCMAWQVTTTNKKQNGYNVPVRLKGFHEYFIIDLLALLSSGQASQPRWGCSHMRWNETLNKWRIVFPMNEASDFMTQEYRYCPICSAPRPEK